MLKRLIRYLVFPEFVGTTINALNEILSGLVFFIGLIHKLLELSRGAVVTMS